ncbi:AGE family epimerase/isomerase [Niabella terrae]
MSNLTPQPQFDPLTGFSAALHLEVDRILQFWAAKTVDLQKGGFIGCMDASGTVDADADKGLVLNSRILWTFASAAAFCNHEPYRQLAERAYRYISDHFIDPEYGGAYWSLDADGIVRNSKKQTYGIAFCIYGLSAYVQLTGDEKALELATGLFRQLQHRALDQQYGGYIEAFDRRWQPLNDLRLSSRDLNAPKTTNTHLHVLEAFAALYAVWPDPELAAGIRQLLTLFERRIMDPKRAGLQLFFTMDWQPTGDEISPGHDIEAAWLLQQCAEVLGDPLLTREFQRTAINMSEAAMAFIDGDGALIYEVHPTTGIQNREKHWWVQAEAMVGFYNAYQLTGKQGYQQQALEIWDFICQHLLDQALGEWYWGVTANHEKMQEPIAGFWKCPYHNARACMELIKRTGMKESKC